MKSSVLRSALVASLVACSSPGGGLPDAAGNGLVAPNETWTFVPIDGMVCADGTPTGVGVNLTDRSDRVMVYFQGGGACWDPTTCFVIKSATHIEGGYHDTDFQSEIASIASSYIIQRTDPNPFKDASWIYVPYCTGDLHDGANVATYNVSGVDKQVHHAGSTNADLVLARVAATRPTTDTVWLVGASAGAYGVGFNWANARSKWPSAKVHVLADSSPLVTLESTRWAAMQTEWKMKFPATCTGCATDLGMMPAALRGEAPAGDRYGLLSYLDDGTISTYFGLTGPQLHTAIVAEQAAMTPGSGQAAFVLTGTSHVVLGNQTASTTTGVMLQTWITQWATGDAAWANAGP